MPGAEAKPLFVFVESNTTGTGRFFTERCRPIGDPLMLVKNPERYPYIAELNVPHLVADTDSVDAMVVALHERYPDRPIAGIWSSSEYYVGSAVELASRFGLRLGRRSAIESCRDKFTQRQTLKRAGIDDITCRRLTISHDKDDWPIATDFPFIIKPSNGSGSVGVQLVSSIDDFRSYANSLSDGDQILVEPVIPGDQFSVEIMSLRIVGITRQHYLSPPRFIACGHDFPAQLSDSQVAIIGDMAVGACMALGLSSGPVHVELRMDGQNCHIIEVNPRLAGGFIPELIRYATGVDLIWATLQFAAGVKPDISPCHKRFASIRFAIEKESGEIGGCVPPNAAFPSSVCDVRGYRDLGSNIAIQGDFRDRYGHVIAASDTPDIAQRHASKGIELLTASLGVGRGSRDQALTLLPGNPQIVNKERCDLDMEIAGQI